VVFATGHIGATLITALGLWTAIRTGHLSKTMESTIDVGVSYGFAAIAAVFTYRLWGRLRLVWALGLIVGTSAALAINQTFTDAGHLIAGRDRVRTLAAHTRSEPTPHRRSGPHLVDLGAGVKRGVEAVRPWRTRMRRGTPTVPLSGGGRTDAP